MTDCPREYKNIGSEAFGNKRKVTEEMLSQFCKNDAYLKEQVDDLWDNTDPETRTNFTEVPANIKESYSVVPGTHEITTPYGTTETKNTYQISDATSFSGSCAFKNYNTIDMNKTTARIDTSNGVAEIPVTVKTSMNQECQNLGPWGGMQANELWYIGWDKDKPYTPSKYLTNPDSNEIPSISRGQTFIPTVSGELKTLTLHLKGHQDAEYPLIIEIYKFPKASYDNTPLAREEYRFNVTSEALVAIEFQSPPKLEKGQKYAFVLRSPLTSFEKAYAVAGWSEQCYNDAQTNDTYPDGGTYLSEDNGYHWISHGKPDNVGYHEGANPPWDFAFSCMIMVSEKKYPTNEEFYVYFKPQFMNPITYAKISPSHVTPSGTSVAWYISQDGKIWKQLNETNNYSSDLTVDGNPNTNFLLLKAVLKTTNANNTPQLSYISLHCDTQKASNAYLKTELIKPRTSPMLGASLWSACYFPYLEEANTHVEVDLFKDTIVRDRFKIIKLLDIVQYYITPEFIKNYYFRDKYVKIHPQTSFDSVEAIDMSDNEAEVIASIRGNSKLEIKSLYTTKHYIDLTDIEAEAIASKYNEILSKINTTNKASEFIQNYPCYLMFLREHNIYLEGTDVLPLSNSVVHPILYANFKAEDSGSETPLAEYHDYVLNLDPENYQLTFDNTVYDTEKNEVSTIQFLNTNDIEKNTTEENTLFKLVPGDLEIEYNPVWVKGLTLTDFEKRDDDGNTVKNNKGYIVYDGFKLDFVKENIVITSTNGILDKEYTLRLEPLCALRKVLYNEGENDEIELYEDLDFTVDYNNKKIILQDNDFHEGDIITVRYTPNLTDTGLGVAYRLSRTNTENNAYIIPGYVETRT